MSEIQKQVENLVVKAGQAEKSEDAMRFSQAAVNVANAAQVLDYVKNGLKK